MGSGTTNSKLATGSACIAMVFSRPSCALSSRKIPSPEMLMDLRPFRLDAQSAPPGVVASGGVTSIALLLIVMDFEFNPAIAVNASEPAPSQF